ncbi:hypothetical protein HanXRQr2_Chr08g0319931 [Helianthus annuus]|uniref:Uncharacterized protein n=1 Tax=Helianthus annuus TaxID=4232 RepID=A0A9K3NAX3_HELAN|nr:hypothetical protein HanXRQr2_Chr08g0319931 [Helianthus annuus]
MDDTCVQLFSFNALKGALNFCFDSSQGLFPLALQWMLLLGPCYPGVLPLNPRCCPLGIPIRGFVRTLRIITTNTSVHSCIT